VSCILLGYVLFPDLPVLLDDDYDFVPLSGTPTGVARLGFFLFSIPFQHFLLSSIAFPLRPIQHPSAPPLR